ncbi:AbiJ-NTD4 domain-containing protein [Paraburkholderia caledonica]|uniref:HEPN AbiJ-N-terminal domain-containing protein n=1 Tax=Paraburkholderia caledonica TaxID=134536 RepID=A0AB73I8P5_9BURK|nr:hypothetical protein [Paraburkholderia caledonica]
MKLRFSQRTGAIPLPEALRPDAMPDALRSSLWNVYLDWLQRQMHERLVKEIWREFWKRPLDTIPYFGYGYDEALKQVRDFFFNSDWYAVYDLLEFLMATRDGEVLAKAVDQVLIRELAAYRVVRNQFVTVTSQQEIEALDAALLDKGVFAPVSEHLATALAHLSNRQNPDYRNSIKESISAVESMAKIISGKDTAELGEALGALEKTGKLHGALRKGYAALYGYTSDANGIRHALMEEPNLSADEAKYFLIACTAFVNYLKTLV